MVRRATYTIQRVRQGNQTADKKNKTITKCSNGWLDTMAVWA